MRILVVGAGATGGFFGGRLVQAGRDVTFLLREGRAAQIRERGLTVCTPGGEFNVQPRVLTAEALRATPERFDLVILSTKAYQMEGAMDDIAPAVGPETAILPILNGMRQLTVLDARFGAAAVLGGSVRVVADVDAEGRVHQKTELGELSYGERDRTHSARMEAVDQAMQNAAFDAIAQPDIVATLWQKWWILASIGTICLLARGTIGQARETSRGEAFARAVVKECTSIATANGYPPDEAMLADHLKRMTEPGSALTSSMYRDLMKGAPVEADHILGDLLDRAQNVQVPLLTAAYVQLKVYEAGRKP